MSKCVARARRPCYKRAMSPTAPLDRLSQSARDILKTNVSDAYTKLVVTGSGDAEAYAALRALTPETMLSSKPLNIDETAALLSGLWLWHDCLDESHKVSQQLHTTSGSMLPAILHRPEGDFSNSKYWVAPCGHHP